MLGEIMKILAYGYYFTWFVWPFVFVFGLALGIKELIQTKKTYNHWLLFASIALLLILAAVIYPIFQ